MGGDRPHRPARRAQEPDLFPLGERQRRASAKTDYDAYLATCPSRQVFDMIGNKWVGVIIAALHDGPLRHGQLRTTIAGVSQKMLTQALRELERDGLVTRTVTASVPPRVDYELTSLGQDLWTVIQPLKNWAEQNMATLQSYRERQLSA